MPVVPLGSTILVTGANGYIAAWIVRTLLNKGYIVKGTVRSEDKGKRLQEIFEKYGDKFQFVVVPDITKEGAFDDAVKDVHAIAHTASPVNFSAVDPQELIKPAVRGTESILRSALEVGSNVRRIIYTSSAAAVLQVDPEPRTFSEDDWNDLSVAEVERDGKDALPITKYRASKTLAERAAWKFFEDNQDAIKWDLVVINPPFVFGPVTHDVPTLSALNLSAAQFHSIVVGHSDEGGKTAQELRSTGNSWIDVRDLAEAQSLALQTENVANERVIVSAGAAVWQEWLDVANSLAPIYLPSHPDLPKGVPISKSDPQIIHQIQYNTSKAERLLGIKYRTKEATVQDTFADYEARGW
ncbi:D-lactaldehyde dehydrogenase [Lentinula lateritia]|nr:D-lactaldehyde dehydrogenase [Lentinula lateritia]